MTRCLAASGTFFAYKSPRAKAEQEEMQAWVDPPSKARKSELKGMLISEPELRKEAMKRVNEARGRVKKSYVAREKVTREFLRWRERANLPQSYIVPLPSMC